MRPGTSWSCDGLAVRFGGTAALDDVTLAGDAGSVTVVVGPSGAGKTTLLRALAGLVAPGRGRVVVAGRDVTAVPAHRRGVAVMFQEPRLFPSMDVADNVGFALRMQKVASATRRRHAEELLADVGLEGFGPRGVRTLSGGEQQRVALARALAAEPRLLLLDEPTASVDLPRRAELRRLLRTVASRLSLTVVAVTHDQHEAAELADRLVVLLDGVVAQQGGPREVFDQPASIAVARFLGAHNLLPAEIRAGCATLGDVHHLPVGSRDGTATLAVRPEHVRLDAEGAWRLRVDDVAFCGSHERVELSTGEVRLRAHVPVGTAPITGSFVGVHLAPDSVRVLDGGNA